MHRLGHPSKGVSCPPLLEVPSCRWLLPLFLSWVTCVLEILTFGTTYPFFSLSLGKWRWQSGVAARIYLSQAFAKTENTGLCINSIQWDVVPCPGHAIKRKFSASSCLLPEARNLTLAVLSPPCVAAPIRCGGRARPPCIGYRSGLPYTREAPFTSARL